ncbi:alpha-mannosidase [Streptosporangium sandarakinum]|uniref:glycoside hydrolase family 38 N-terminal domain-containing protein n=1 Tax=Streptosporangium sandarakinum TaxID=1260955 RepID=UPI003D8E11B4
MTPETAGVPDVSAAPGIVVVPHTHWDREWYLPFQRFRLGLVRLLDEVLDTMAADPAYRFTMDGQLAALEDYLEIRPERLGEVRRLVAEGRFAAGPWLILADEFLCSGETLIRNLEYGMRGAEELGGAMRVGYLPDQFGHCAQMPQILRQAGLEHACLWRGVPAAVERDAFAWVGADGTAIRTQYLPGGYGNAVALFTGPAGDLADRLAAFASIMRPWHPEGPLLAMYGADHSAPAADITAAGLRLATLEEYVTAHDPGVSGLPAVHGELRSHARANILPGVISARLPAKRLMARAERVVARYAEPLAALWLPGDTVAARLLDLAWRRLIACSGHDSITGCGADETAQQVAARIAEAGQIGQAVVDLVASSLAAGTARDAVVVVNPSPFRRTGLVLAGLPESRPVLTGPGGARVAAQRLELAPTLLDETVMDDLALLLGRVHDRELFGQRIVSWSVGGDSAAPCPEKGEAPEGAPPASAGGSGAVPADAPEGVFTVVVARDPATGYEYADLRAAVLDAAAARPGPWRVRIVAEPVVTVAALVTVEAFGRTVLTPAAGGGFGGESPAVEDPMAGAVLTGAGSAEDRFADGIPRDPFTEYEAADEIARDPFAEDGAADGIPRDPFAEGGAARPGDVPRSAEGVLDNGLLRVTVAPDGTLSLRSAGAEVHGVGRVVDGGDAGDTYNHAPPRHDVLVDAPSRVEVETLHTGPLVSVLEIRREYAWPAHEEEDGRSAAREDVTVTTRAELRAGEPYLRLEISFDNRCRDHRVRWHAPLRPGAAESFAEGQLSVTRRGTAAEGGCGEEPLPTFPAEGFVAAGGLAVLLDQVTEYELTGGELALTLLRSVGLLSRNRNAYRDEPAGPQIATPEAQCPGPAVLRFAVLPCPGAWHEAGLPRLAEEYRHDLLVVPGGGPAIGPAARAEERGAGTAGNGTGADPVGGGAAGTLDGTETGPAGQAVDETLDGTQAGPAGQVAEGTLDGMEAGPAGQAAEGTLDGAGARLEVEGIGVVLTALRERDGALEARLVAEHPRGTEAVIRGAFIAARRADLLGVPGERLEAAGGEVRLPLRPFEIATVHLIG